MTDLVARLGEIADYFMETGWLPSDYKPFSGVKAEVYPPTTSEEILSGNISEPIEIRFSAYTHVQTFVTSRPWSTYKKRQPEVPTKRPLRFLSGLLYNRKRGR